MRLQINIPEEAWERVKKLATSECRPPRYQLEHLILEALRTRQKDQPSSNKEVAHAN
jgi:hypothetical protein